MKVTLVLINKRYCTEEYLNYCKSLNSADSVRWMTDEEELEYNALYVVKEFDGVRNKGDIYLGEVYPEEGR